MVTRGQIYRAVFVQPLTGHVVDAQARFSMPSNIITTTEKTMRVDGTSRVISRLHSLSFPLLRECDISSLRQMCGQGWPVICYVIGFNVHGVWAVAESLDVTDVRRAPASMAGSAASLRSHVFDGAIYQSYNLVEGIPWACTSSYQLPVASGLGSGSGAGIGSGSGSLQDYILARAGQTGWDGPAWDPGGRGAEVDFVGELTKSGQIDPTLSMIMPIQGATLKISGEENATQARFYDWSGVQLPGTITKTNGIDSASGQVPDGTWRIVFSVDEAHVQPIIEITNPGPEIDPRPGIYVGPDKVQNGVPQWSS